ncbi:hypothetical protein [Streptomyces sp. NPDC053048]
MDDPETREERAQAVRDAAEAAPGRPTGARPERRATDEDDPEPHIIRGVD